MTLRIIDYISLGAGAANEDRAGGRNALAWVIDGATDVVDTPLTAGGSDAAWLAQTLDDELCRRADGHGGSLDNLIGALTDAAALRFAAVATRAPVGRGEHPSAAGIICHHAGDRLDYVSLGDCALIAGVPGEPPLCHGIGLAGAGDAALAAAIDRFNSGRDKPSAAAARRHIWPAVRAKRAAMNTAGGYGILSITPPPASFIARGSLSIPPGIRVLLMTDGLARLVDVFARYTPAAMFEAACRHGLASLAAELRRIEDADPECGTYPRAKPSDDATGLLLTVD